MKISAPALFVGFVLLGECPADDRLTVHRKAKPLPDGALTADWPRFLGPSDDATTPEVGEVAVK